MKNLSDLIKWESEGGKASLVDTLNKTLNSIVGPLLENNENGNTVDGVFFKELLSKEVKCSGAEYERLQSLIGEDSTSLIKAMHYGALKIDSEGSVVGGVEAPSYHNKEHFSCALAAAGVLSNSEFKKEQYHLKLLTCCAMLFHDLGHDGGTNSIIPSAAQNGAKSIHLQSPQNQRLEWVAVNECEEFLNAAGVSKSTKEIIRQCILNTDPALTIANRKKYNELCTNLEEFDESNEAQVVQRLSAICNDADVTFSLLPKSGLELGRSLSQEWEQIEHPQAQVVGSFEGRLGFLKFFSPMSEGAKKIGLLDVVSRQIEAFSLIGQGAEQAKSAGLSLDVAGARYLDQSNFNLSKNTFLKKLMKTNVEPGIVNGSDVFSDTKKATSANDKKGLAMA